MRWTATITLCLLASSGYPCMWDRDTLAEETANKMDLVAVIVGQFPRNPPLYYSMRVERVRAELKKSPNRLDLYEDLAVGLDRLDLHDQSLATMNLERPHLRAFPSDKEAWYHYYANIGTFRVHRWITRGLQKAEISELNKAISEISKALEINPNAHFGRERMQLEFMQWMRSNVGKSPKADFNRWILEGSDISPERQVAGIAGLIRLGAAWESVDAYYGLAAALSLYNQPKKASVAHLAVLRAEELRKEGRKSLVEAPYNEFDTYPLWMPSQSLQPYNGEQFQKLRRQADRWQKTRTDFMLAKLKLGRHPDTDPAFWNGYRPAPPLSIEEAPFWAQEKKVWAAIPWILLGGLLTLVGVIYAAVRLTRLRRNPWGRGRM